MVPGKKISPVVLVESISRIMPERRLRLRMGRIAWVDVAPRASVASICGAGVVDVAEAVEGDCGCRHRVADHRRGG